MVYEPLYHDLQNGERTRDFLGLFVFIVVTTSLVFYMFEGACWMR